MTLLVPNMLHAEDSPGPSVLEELEETVESPVCDPLKEVGTDVIQEELHSDCSDRKNVKSSVGLDIGCITNEFPSQVEIEKYILPVATSHYLNNSQRTYTIKLFQKVP